jgi:hypothetical protein
VEVIVEILLLRHCSVALEAVGVIDRAGIYGRLSRMAAPPRKQVLRAQHQRADPARYQTLPRVTIDAVRLLAAVETGQIDRCSGFTLEVSRFRFRMTRGAKTVVVLELHGRETGRQTQDCQCPRHYTDFQPDRSFLRYRPRQIRFARLQDSPQG